MKKSFLFLADGFEEIEALTVVDVMRRAGLPVVTVSVSDSLEVAGAHGIKVQADELIADVDCDDAEWLIAPGGMPGSTNLAACDKLNKVLKTHHANEGRIAAICAAPAVVLAPLGILNGQDATCYPGFEDKCERAVMRDTPVVASGNIITANGPASALRFALSIVAHSLGEGVANEVGCGMLFYPKEVNFYF